MLKSLDPLLTHDVHTPATARRHIAPQLLDAAELDVDDVFRRCETSAAGLSNAEAQRRLQQYGPNNLLPEARYRRLKLLARAVFNPLVILLVLLGVLSFVTGDSRAGSVMFGMVLLGVVLRFVQESRAAIAAAQLKTMIRVTATVVRDGQRVEVPLADLVPGDVVLLAAGDMIPADVRLVASKDLYVIQASLTGESFPVEKQHVPEAAPNHSPLELKSICFLGTSVESGTARAVVICTGSQTYLGGVASTLLEPAAPTSFDRGINRFTWLMIRLIAVMVPLVFVINGLTKGDWKEAFFFALAVAVGLTPEMLPMIVTVCLSRGALTMSRQRVIVKRLNSLQNLGAMDILCTDKTGTLTMDQIVLERHCDVVLRESDEVLALAYLNSHFQTGLKNVMDRAILDYQHLHEQLQVPQCEKIDEIPFDFVRKVMSVVVRLPNGTCRLICKGAPEAVFKLCHDFELDGEHLPLEQVVLDDLHEEFNDLSSDGFRVLAFFFNDMYSK